MLRQRKTRTLRNIITRAEKAALTLEQLKLEAVDHGIRHPEKIQAAGNVMCRGQKRPVYLINGSFVMDAGHNTSRELALADLGGKPCRCVAVLNEIRLKHIGKIPKAFRTFAREASSRRIERENIRKADRNRELLQKLRADSFGLVQRKVRLMLKHKCRYETTKNPRCIISIERTIGMGQCHSVYGCNVNVELNSLWHRVLSPAGLGCIDDMLVVDMIEKAYHGQWVHVSESKAKRIIKDAQFNESIINVLIVVEANEKTKYGRLEHVLKTKVATIEMCRPPVLKRIYLNDDAY